MPLVFQIIPTLYAGGAERFVIELASRLPKFGYRAKIAVLFEGGPLRELARDRGIELIQLSGATRMNRLSLMNVLSRMIREEGEARPSVVHTHLFGADFWTGLSQMSVSATQRPVMISTAHNIDPDDGAIRRLSRKMVAPMFDRVISVSEEVKRYTIQSLGVSSKKAMMIDGMCLLQPGLRPAQPFHQPPRIITVARLEPQKGIETALRALANVPPPWSYTIIGAGALERDLKELSERLGISSRVTFAGVSMRVAESLQSSDLFLFPSRWEGLGSVALEAAWAGIPVLTSDLDPLRSVFPKEQRLSVDDVPAWTNAIKSVLANSDLALESASNLAPQIASRFHPDVITKRYAEVYDELIGKRDTGQGSRE